MIAASSVADLAAVALLSLLFSTSGGSTGGKLVLLALFAALVAVIGAAVALAGPSMRLGDVLTRLQDTTAEIRVRAAVVLLPAFVAELSLMLWLLATGVRPVPGAGVATSR